MATLITGGTGFLGRHILDRLGESDIYATSRNADRARSTLKSRIADAIEWDPMTEDLALPAEPAFDSVINLMGESIAEGRWTESKKKSIRDSRVLGTKRLVKALLEQPIAPKVVVSASAVGLYGDTGKSTIDESQTLASGFLAEVCQHWEAALDPLVEAGVRVVKIRIGIVLGKEGGALEQLVPIFKWGIGGRLGNGKQYVPWIHVDDLAELFCWALMTETATGVYNGSAPNPVTNAELTKQLTRTLHRPAFIPVPKFALRLVLGEFANSLFNSQRAVPKAALDQGFQFRFNHLEEALQNLLGGD